MTAREILSSNLYLTLATADEEGRPWASPVYYASEDYEDFYWVSDPEAMHSRNLAVRPRAGAVVFDTRAPIGTGQAVYMALVAEMVAAAELERGIAIFSRVSLSHGGTGWAVADVTEPARLRLYRATATEWWELDATDRRIPADPRS
jgi:nitroimidazol reductase NimA-like FMN-containing flavoprotein (pyridoxamine 5'-phosphate oxidase superfamily)